MPKAYWIARVDVRDPETYKKYVETAKPAFERHKAKFLARGGKHRSAGRAGSRPQCGDRVSLHGRGAGLLEFAGIHRGARHPRTRERGRICPCRRGLKPRRTALFVPAANIRALEKARGLAADVVILDLEDAVAPEEKDAARDRAIKVARDYAPRETVVRINSAGTPWHAADLKAVAGSAADAILLPKITGRDDVIAAQGCSAGQSRLGDDRDAARGVQRPGHRRCRRRLSGARAATTCCMPRRAATSRPRQSSCRHVALRAGGAGRAHHRVGRRA